MAAALLLLLPAVDVTDGRAARLVQGEACSETEYGAPLEAALAWQGCTWLTSTPRSAAATTPSSSPKSWGGLDVAVELSGGIRNDESLAAALATGCARVNFGTAALERPDWLRRAIVEHGKRIAVGLDVRGSTP